MTKRKKAGNDEKKKGSNKTANQRAMASPKVQAALSPLRGHWSNLSPQQRGEQVIILVGLGCSVRGIAKELGVAETNIRRDLARAKSEETDGGWIEMMQRTLAKVPSKQKTMSPREKGTKPVIKKRLPVTDLAQPSTTQQTKKIIPPPSTRDEERQVVNSELSGNESRPGESEPKVSLVDLYKLSKGQRIEDRVQRLAAISNSIESPTSPRCKIDAATGHWKTVTYRKFRRRLDFRRVLIGATASSPGHLDHGRESFSNHSTRHRLSEA
jgi:hypothetical protein